MVDCGIQVYRFGIYLRESARDSPAWWQRCFAASVCELGSWLGFLRDVGFFISYFEFYLRDLLPILMESTPVDAGVVFIIVILDCIVMYIIFIIILFILCCCIYFI
jgi:hypothetical protein